jgi:hypothetical protein
MIGNTDYRSIGHHLPGLFKFTIPASLIALWVFHNIIKGPVIGLLPIGMQERLRNQRGAFHFGGLRRFAAILVSIGLGVATHLVWDSFTHSDTFMLRHVRWLRKWIYVPFIGDMPLHSVLQYGSSIAGLLALGLWVWLWYRRTAAVESPSTSRPRSRFTLAVAMLLLAGVAGLVRALLVVGMPAFRSNAHSFLLVFGVTSLALTFWQLLLYCVLVSTHQMWILN